MKEINTITNIIKYEKLNEIISAIKLKDLDISDSYIYSCFQIIPIPDIYSYYYFYIGKRKTDYYFIPVYAVYLDTKGVFSIDGENLFYIISDPNINNNIFSYNNKQLRLLYTMKKLNKMIKKVIL